MSLLTALDVVYSSLTINFESSTKTFPSCTARRLQISELRDRYHTAHENGLTVGSFSQRLIRLLAETCGARCELRFGLRFSCCLQEPALRLALNLDCTLSLQKTQRGAPSGCPVPKGWLRQRDPFGERPVRRSPRLLFRLGRISLNSLYGWCF